MREVTADGIDLFVPRVFPAGVFAGLVGRSAGARGGRGLSFAAGSATPPHEAAESRALLAARLGVEPGDLVFAAQVHGARVVRAVRGARPGEADGMATDEGGLVLCLAVADCCAVLVHDPRRGAVGAFHAGWRGTRDRIVTAGIRFMTDTWGSRPSELLVWLGPCASGERYEVGGEVAALFPRSARVRRGPAGARLTLDLREELALELLDTGVREERIERSAVCTIADPRCHSYRRDGDRSGRMAAYIVGSQRPG